MNKTCIICKQPNDISQYISLQNGKEVKVCLDCRNKNKAYRASGKSTKAKMYVYYNQLKKDMGGICSQCGDDDITHLDLDHLDPVNKIECVSACLTEVKMKEEAEKCQLLCLKCHRVRSIQGLRDKWKEHKYSNNKSVVQSRERKKRNLKYINNLKKSLGGCQNPECKDIFDKNALEFYEFDHKDPLTKIRAIASMVADGLAIKTIDEELEKCILLCGYCHRKHTKDHTKHFINLKEPVIKPKLIRKNMKLTTGQVNEIREKWDSGEYRYHTEIAKEYKVSGNTISDIIGNRHRSDNPVKPKKFVAKLTDDEVREVRKLALDPSKFYAEIGKQFGISKQYVYDIVKGRRKKEVI